MRNEKLVCVPTEIANNLFRSFTDYNDEMRLMLSKQVEPNITIIKREDAEINLNYKQLVVYIVIHYRDKLLIYNRGNNETEKRLVSKWGCISGHVNHSDTVFIDHCNCGWEHENNSIEETIKYAAMREYHEELNLWSGYEPTIAPEHFDLIGFINCNKTEVDKVHLGAVVELHLERIVKPIEGLARIAYINKNELSITLDRIYDAEEWLKLVARYYKDVNR